MTRRQISLKHPIIDQNLPYDPAAPLGGSLPILFWLDIQRTSKCCLSATDLLWLKRDIQGGWRSGSWPITDVDSRSDVCPAGLHQLSARLLQLVALWNCRQSTKAATVRPERGSVSDYIIGMRRTEHITPVLESLH